jgi:hypothetical protein
MSRQYSPWHALPVDLSPDPLLRPDGWYARVSGRYQDGSPFEQFELGDASGAVPRYPDFETALTASIRLLRRTVGRRAGGAA